MNLSNKDRPSSMIGHDTESSPSSIKHHASAIDIHRHVVWFLQGFCNEVEIANPCLLQQ
jgi:hypothetical protein